MSRGRPRSMPTCRTSRDTLTSHEACQDCVALKDKKIGEQEMKFIHQVR